MYKKRNDSIATITDFELQCTLGQGSFGAVVNIRITTIEQELKSEKIKILI